MSGLQSFVEEGDEERGSDAWDASFDASAQDSMGRETRLSSVTEVCDVHELDVLETPISTQSNARLYHEGPQVPVPLPRGPSGGASVLRGPSGGVAQHALSARDMDKITNAVL